MDINIGEKIRSLRQKNNLTQKELADRCELSKGFISQLESNQTSPSLSTLEDILTTLGSSFHEFFSDEQGDNPVCRKEDGFIKESDDDNSHPPFPFICLLVSGGNSQIVKVNAYNDMEVLGQTIDDAAGEAIDKC